MAEITRNDRQYQGVVNKLARQFLSSEKSSLIFLGAGVGFDAKRAHLPTGSDLSQALAKECHLPWYKHIPLSTIAFYYEFFFRRDALNLFLKARIDKPDIQPSSTLQMLMKIIKVLETQSRSVLVTTTNYDQHFERAYQAEFGRSPGVIVYRGGEDANLRGAALHEGIGDVDPRTWLPRGSGTHLYKMHGCITHATLSQGDNHNLVITEEDYINFLSNALSHDENKMLLPYVLGKISRSSPLFIGYSLADWNFRVIFKATAERYDLSGYAVQYFDDPKGEDLDLRKAMIDFWGNKKIDILNVDAVVFVEDLASALAALVEESVPVRA